MSLYECESSEELTAPGSMFTPHPDVPFHRYPNIIRLHHTISRGHPHLLYRPTIARIPLSTHSTAHPSHPYLSEAYRNCTHRNYIMYASCHHHLPLYPRNLRRTRRTPFPSSHDNLDRTQHPQILSRLPPALFPTRRRTRLVRTRKHRLRFPGPAALASGYGPIDREVLAAEATIASLMKPGEGL
ncbi:hypothetical protein HGRIS_001308 [Hohenbuehelia grisea]|uniref:Uncharacterized protein n=1 Tax=Hohenbuehelia grisea TaxID=104357 RepID=A0ABR3JNX7_9AGAR